jgi:hypothetical protein
MPGLNRALPVPYFVQPTNKTCQSTVLKMYASYLEQNVVLQSTSAAAQEITDIWKDINLDPKRPSKILNAHANMKWWLERHFPSLKFHYLQTQSQIVAVEKIVSSINGGFPVLVSVSHIRVQGHIILVTGYESYLPNVSSAGFKFIVHDPYGRFDPSLHSKVFGKRRLEGGASLLSGGERGPGLGTRVPIEAVSRHRPGDAHLGTYYLISATR